MSSSKKKNGGAKKAGSAPTTKIAFGNEWQKVVPSTAADIEIAQAKLGCTFPSLLQELLTECGAGYPKKNYFLSPESDTEVSVGYVLPPRDARVSGVVTECLTWRKAQDLPTDVIPFAFDNGNANLLCVNLHSGEVVYWLHDDHAHRSRKLAGSLADFLKGLAPSPF